MNEKFGTSSLPKKRQAINFHRYNLCHQQEPWGRRHKGAIVIDGIAGIEMSVLWHFQKDKILASNVARDFDNCGQNIF